jgi:5-hydroxyisourate hydrolase
MGRLTTLVMDTAHGCPGAGISVRLYADAGIVGRGALICEMLTNKDGRCEAPLLGEEKMRPGRYMLAFDVAAYFRAKGVALTDPPFLENVRIHFGIASPEANYHVPLFVSPYAYSTHRGS